MVVLNGRFDGTQIILEGPVPKEIPINAPVRAIFDEDSVPQSLAEIARLAHVGGHPPDYAEQHEHYTRGTPKR